MGRPQRHAVPVKRFLTVEVIAAGIECPLDVAGYPVLFSSAHRSRVWPLPGPDGFLEHRYRPRCCEDLGVDPYRSFTLGVRHARPAKDSDRKPCAALDHVRLGLRKVLVHSHHQPSRWKRTSVTLKLS